MTQRDASARSSRPRPATPPRAPFSSKGCQTRRRTIAQMPRRRTRSIASSRRRRPRSASAGTPRSIISAAISSRRGLATSNEAGPTGETRPSLIARRRRSGVASSPNRCAKLGQREDLRLLGLERLGNRTAEAHDRLRRLAARALEQALDPLQVEAVGLKLRDQLQPRHMARPVVADALAHLGRRQQAPCLVSADVPDAHAALGRELLDGERVFECLVRRAWARRPVDPAPCADGTTSSDETCYQRDMV